jgi:hypothetical protein
VTRVVGSLLVAVAVLVATPRSALANSPAPFTRDPSRLEGASVERQTPLVVEREDLAFTCSERDHEPDGCFEAVYHVLNPTDERQEVLGAFYGIEAEATSIRAGGTAGMDAAVRALGKDLDYPGREPESAPERGPPMRRTGFVLGVDARAAAPSGDGYQTSMLGQVSF